MQIHSILELKIHCFATVEFLSFSTLKELSDFFSRNKFFINCVFSSKITSGYCLSSLGVPGVPWHPHILADQVTLSQPRGTDYAHQIILAPPDFQTFRRPCIACVNAYLIIWNCYSSIQRQISEYVSNALLLFYLSCFLKFDTP